MIPVACSWRIHQASGRKKVSTRLLLTVNNKLMFKADFRGRDVPNTSSKCFTSDGGGVRDICGGFL